MMLPNHLNSMPAMTSTCRPALWSVRLMFFLTGALFATWAARIPAIQSQLDVDHTGLAIAFAGLNLGAIVGLQAGGFITPRFGSRAVLRLVMPLFALSLSVVLLANNLTGLSIALGVFAFANSLVDVSMNAHGVAVERIAGRPLLSSMHAYHSLGMISGAGLGALAAQAGLSIRLHFSVVSLLIAVIALFGSRALLPSAVDTASAPVPDGFTAPRRARHWPKRLVILGGVAFCVALAEGAANDWAAVYLHERGASSSLAAVGFGAFVTAMFLGRLAGDHLVSRFGPVRPFLLGTMTAGIGMGAALIIGGMWIGIVGFALFGFGISYTLPVALSASRDVSEVHPTRAIANISTLGYMGFFSGPMLIGIVATPTSLAIGLAVPVAFVFLAGLGARAVNIREQGPVAITPSGDRSQTYR
ncbi:MFS transporter [Micromonospora sp. NPDC050695]|uniref:MFS transporter n=1 Tax=Micromonospora sp. NPDC050695 TaxID=3154938 RepID=UPI0033C9FCE0